MKLTELIPDKQNANRGTVRGRAAVRKSLERCGAGRSIVTDRNGVIIAGNKTTEAAQAAGIRDAIVVESDGSKLVVVRRTDLDIDDQKARELAIADNRAGQLGLEWDPEVLAELSGDLDLQPYFSEHELSSVIAPDADSAPEGGSTKEVDPDDFEFNCRCPKCGFEFNN